MDTVTLIKRLSDSVCIGNIHDALDIAREYLDGTCEIEMLTGGNLALKLKGKGDHTLLFDAHIDEIGFIVNEITDGGFLKVSCAGGFDLRALPSHAVTVHGKKPIPAVFTSVPPHLAKDDGVFDDIAKLSVDTGLGKKAKEYCSVGNFVTFRQEAKELKGGKITGKSLDNRAGVAALLLLADKLKGKELPQNVTILLSNQEEIGCRGAKTASFTLDANESVCVDVSFASFPGIAANECGKLSKGPMLGYSPVLSREIFLKLVAIAERENIPFQREIMGSTTSTNADAITLSKSGIPSALVSIPLRYMHSDCEVIDKADVEAVAELLYNYAMSGGALCD